MATKAVSAVKIDWNALFLNSLAPMIQGVLTTVLVELLLKLKPVELKTVLVSLYGPVDVQLEGLVIKSQTRLDDAAVMAIKNAIEQAAAINGITLPNLDTD